MSLVIAVAAIALLIGAPASAADVAPLHAEIAHIAQPIGGTVGVASWRLDGRRPRVLFNADQRFPMASTFKVAVAGAILSKVDRGELSLDQLVPVDPEMVVQSEGLASTFRHPGISVSIKNLLELMLTVSDNTATDVLTKIAGGPAAVTAWVRAQGVDGLRVDRDTAGLIRDFFRLPPGPFPQALDAALRADPKLEDRGSEPNAVFDTDPRDSSTPTAMAELLQSIFTGKALKPATTQLLTEIMQRNTTGKTRIPGRLPNGTVVAEKTGTIGGSLNDVGLITLPGNAGKLIVAIFIKQSAKPFEDRERVIADISRALYDYFLFEEPK